MELLVCKKCHTIIMPYVRNRTVVPMPHHEYMVLGKRCGCGSEVFVRRWTHEYVLKEVHDQRS